MDATLLRAETPTDQSAIYAVHTAAFPTDAEARLVNALRAAQRLVISWVAEAEEAGRVVGHVGFSPIMLGEQAVGLGLAPMAVLPTHQRRGIGSQLIRASLQACAQMNVALVVVLGDPHYYQRFGFTRASERGLGNEYGVDAEFMAQALRTEGWPPTPGVVRYAPEFALVE